MSVTWFSIKQPNPDRLVVMLGIPITVHSARVKQDMINQGVPLLQGSSLTQAIRLNKDRHIADTSLMTVSIQLEKKGMSNLIDFIYVSSDTRYFFNKKGNSQIKNVLLKHKLYILIFLFWILNHLHCLTNCKIFKIHVKFHVQLMITTLWNLLSILGESDKRERICQ